MNSLACLYTDQRKYDLTEKYFLMAAKTGDIISIHGLAWVYNKKGNYELSRRYYVMSALHNNKISIEEINRIMEWDFDLDDSVKLANVLSNHNQDVLNDILKFVVMKYQWLNSKKWKI